MIDKSVNPDDEYRFSDVQAPPVMTDAYAPPGVDPAMQVKRGALLLIGLCLIGMAGYKLLGVISSHSNEKTNLTTTQHPVAHVVKPAPKVEAAKPILAATPAIEVNLQKNIDALQAAKEATDTQLQQQQTNITQLQAQLQALQTKTDQLNTTLTEVNDKLTKLTTPPPAPKVTHKKKAAVVPVQARAPKYYIKALLPGRAWLIDAQNGAMLTVGLGDLIPGLGNITTIDPDRGVISLSSGNTISFSPSDH